MSEQFNKWFSELEELCARHGVQFLIGTKEDTRELFEDGCTVNEALNELASDLRP